MRARAHIAIAFGLAVLWLPAAVCAQEDTTTDPGDEGGETEGETRDGADEEDGESVEGEPQYEPDQRGANADEEEEEEEVPLYEPDQRGVVETQGRIELDRQTLQRERTVSTADGGGDGGSEEVMEASADSGGFGGESLFDLQLWLGGGLTSLDGFGSDNLVGRSQLDGGALSTGLVFALHFGPVRIGPRVGLAVHDAFVLPTVGLDVQVELMTGHFRPIVRAAVSYAFLLSIDDALPSQSDALVSGVTTELGIGFITSIGGPFTFGADVSATYLHLTRPEVPNCMEPCMDSELDLRRGGSADGIGLRLQLFTGVSF